MQTCWKESDRALNNLLIGIAVGAVAVCIIGWIILSLRVLKPLKRLTELTGHLKELDAEEISSRAARIDGAPGKAARAIASYAGMPERDGAAGGSGNSAAAEAYQLGVADEISRSLLPQLLKETAASQSVSLAADLLEGTRRNCDFYDYFFLDETSLCLMVGQVPGFGIPEALFAVVAQTTIRSRLRMGRSLVETMSDVNAQLYDLGGRNYVRVLVSVLNTVNGRFSYVNAGGAMPFLMRSEERYEWLKTPVYAPLGANESVVYRPEVLRLNQGDRLFFYTEDLGEMTNREGEEFREREFQAALNRSRSQTRSPEELLHFMQDEAAAFCERGDDVVGSAALTLEYRKGNRDFVFTMVRAAPENAPVVTDFMRKTLEDGGIAPRDRAKQILLADELFSLCCRVCEAEADIKVECAIRQEENTIQLRMFAPMGGRDPLYSGQSEADGNAANYIRTHTRRASFESGIERDMIEIVSELN